MRMVYQIYYLSDGEEVVVSHVAGKTEAMKRKKELEKTYQCNFYLMPYRDN